MFQFPPCAQVKLKPPSPLKITLPTGGTLTAFSDLSKGIPSDCSQTFSLMLQIAPFLGSIECLLKVLGLIGPLIEFVKAVPDPIKLASTVPKVSAGCRGRHALRCGGHRAGHYSIHQRSALPHHQGLELLPATNENPARGHGRSLAIQLSAAQANSDTDLGERYSMRTEQRPRFWQEI